MFWTYVDASLIAMGLSAAIMTVLVGLNTGTVATKLGELHAYQDFYTLAVTRHKLDVALAGVLFLSWVKVCSVSGVVGYFW